MHNQPTQLSKPLLKLVDVLLPIYQKPFFEQQFKTIAKSISNQEQFKVKSELARLYKPFERTIDMSRNSQYDVEEFNWEGKRFYLDEIGRRMFLLEVEKFGNQYTEGVYERITNPEIYKQYENHFLYEQKIKEFEVPITELGRTSRRLEERMYLSKPVKIETDDGMVIEAFTSNISKSGCLVKVDKFGFLKAGQIVGIDFHSITRDHVFDGKTVIEYQVVFAARKPDSHGEQKIGFVLAQQNDEWYKFISRFIAENRMRFKVDITNAIDLAESRLLEDHLLRATDWLPIFVTINGGQVGNVRYTLSNEFNQQHLSFFHDEQGAQRLHSILYKIWPLLSETQNETLAVARFIKQGKVLFLATTLSQLKKENTALSFFNFIALQSGELGLFQIKSYGLSENDLSEIRDSWFATKKEGDIALKPLKHLNQVIMMYRLTQQQELMIPTAATPMEKSDLAVLNQYVCPRIKATNISSFKVDPGESRCERRYFYQTELKVNLPQQRKQFDANTLDMSNSGLKVQLISPLQLEQGDYIELTATAFKKFGKNNMLNKAKYKIVGINPVQNHLHLQLAMDEHHEATKQFMQRLFKANAGKLRMNDEYDKFLLLQKALRIAFVSFYPSISFGVANDKKHLLQFCRLLVTNKKAPELAAISRMQSPINDGQISVFQLIHDDKRSPPFIRSLTRFARNKQSIEDELVFHMLPNRIDIPKQARAGSNPRLVLQYIRKALSTGQFCALNIKVHPIEIDNIELIEKQLTYIAKYNKHKSEEIRVFSQRLMGMIEVLDVSDVWQAVGKIDLG